MYLIFVIFRGRGGNGSGDRRSGGAYRGSDGAGVGGHSLEARRYDSQWVRQQTVVLRLYFLHHHHHHTSTTDSPELLPPPPPPTSSVSGDSTSTLADNKHLLRSPPTIGYLIRLLQHENNRNAHKFLLRFFSVWLRSQSYLSLSLSFSEFQSKFTVLSLAFFRSLSLSLITEI